MRMEVTGEGMKNIYHDMFLSVVETILKHTTVTLHPTDDVLCLIFSNEDGMVEVSVPFTKDFVDTRYTLKEWLEELEDD